MPEVLSIIDKHKPQIATATSVLGQRGERMAADYLMHKGYRLIVSNFKVPVGRNRKGVQVTGEIDIVALDDGVLVFAEVKTRRSEEFIPVIAAVNLRKQRQIARTARVYRRIFSVFDLPYRYDVITVLWAKHAEPVIEHAKGFWNDSVFRKRAWSGDSWYHF